MLDPVGVPAEPVTFMIYQEQTEGKSKRAALSPVSKRANFRSSPGFFCAIFHPFPFSSFIALLPRCVDKYPLLAATKKEKGQSSKCVCTAPNGQVEREKGVRSKKNATNEFPPLFLSLSPLPRLSLNPHSTLLSDCATVSFSLRSIGRGRKKSSKALPKGWLGPLKKIV